jgi:tetratricopeptide (TPR) repeat protein
MPAMQPTLGRRLLRSPWPYLGLGLLSLSLAFLLIANWFYEHDLRVRFRVQEAWAALQELIDPQAVIVPTPVPQSAVAMPTFASTPTALPSSTPTLQPTQPPGDTATPAPTGTATPAPTALPAQIMLTGFRHEYQLFNNCGPASLSINLSFWGWSGEQRQAASVLKPNQDDKNVSPRELYEYGLTQGYDAYIRVNGDLETLKRFIAAGYPVLVEKGFTCVRGENCNGWFGHYSVFVGFDDAQERFYLQDSYRGPNITMTYADVVANWRAFNYLYLVFFPQGEAQDAAVQKLLGSALDVTENYRAALERARQEAQSSTGEAAAFAWFNVGTNLFYLNDYAGAAAAYDQSRQIGLPYRMLWYQFGPYVSYYYMSRYQDVVDLATFAIDSVNTVPGLEEAYYWRGMAEIALGQPDKAAEDFRTALQRHAGYKPALEGLAQLGLAP